MNLNRSSRVAILSFSLFILFALVSSSIIETNARPRSKGRSAAQKRKKSDRRGARSAKLSRRERRQLARNGRSRGRVSKREMRAERARLAREQSAYIAKLQRRSGRKLSKRELAAEIRRFQASHRRDLEAARRRAAAARAAAIARQRAIDEGMRNEVEANIAKDITVGEDLEVRQAAINALGHHAGTVVVMDPKSGRVYTVVNQDWGLRRGFKPCSTIKLVTGVAGISEKVIQPVEAVSVGGNYSLNLTEALAHSNNTYFQRVGGEVGFDKMVSYAREMGLGEKTGINYPNESPGRVPLYKTGYAVNHMSSHGDDFEVTAIQLASLVSAMSNGGKLVTPHVPRTVEENSKFKTETRRKVNIEGETWKRMLPGMIGAVNYGSGRKAYRPEQTVAGKTGTCIGQGSWLGLFTSYAPVVDPRLAIVVITRGADARNHLPAAVAGDIYRSLSPRFGTPIDFQVAKGEGEAGDKKAADLDEEAQETKAATEAEENAEEAAEEKTSSTTTDARANPAQPENKSKVKATVMPIESKSKASPSPAAKKPEGTDAAKKPGQPNQ